MSTTRLSSKGQVIIPKHVREAHGWTAGQEFEIVETDTGIVLQPRSPFSETTLDEVVGCAEYDGPRVSTERLTGTYAHCRKLGGNNA